MRRPVPEQPGPGQESVWDYPRPPRLEATSARLEVVLGGVAIASTTHGWRVLETSHPPTYYLPREDFLPGALRPAEGSSTCEWKGRAAYVDLVGGERGDRVAPRAGWTYPEPTPAFRDLAGAVAVMAGAVDACFVDGERVVPQPGGFYGGWITSAVVGPFKGDPGTWGW
ncbi:DUF427 domain-containing protein [Nocardioides sp. zg-579]|uniref:DUF427 domain-containing protein n=1 Tax=Nocardioides marmotae TaxID=2663857 RepID=A0A6I3JDQ1_9ACTN|nr:DUF427 domain-containing protein [Nocardioides marmotae]MCR6032687.1 DUF427 domain-containing protein [Gordonia jinghuaiqii]MTB96336.1 DUF427 domain-containing protein [Nocardioides marmotae]QKE03180.1 DUF427 domain-containing protein [Nocardioides marmotae]